jgi:uncharacterized integral membrane protein
MKTLQRFKLILMAAALILLVVVILQNTEAVSTEILFFSVSLPRALLLAVMAVIGFALGLLAAARSRSRSRSDQTK